LDLRARPGLAPYASDASASRGRLHPEPESPTRTPFQRDRDRIIHAGAFRRLKHKTQVFVAHYGDYYRTRLTHSLEVSQVARTLARSLNLDEDLAEALALAHDLGHPPFGHAGEDALQQAMAPYGGFDHNAQTLEVITQLEARYAEFDGLNLTWETLEGIAKHNGPQLREAGKPLPELLVAYNLRHDLELDTFASLEAQVAAISDDIAYNNHDLDDGLRAGLFSIDDLRSLPLVGEVVAHVEARYPKLESKRLIQETIRRLITAWIDDVYGETRTRLARVQPNSADDVRRAGEPLVGFSSDMRLKVSALRRFLFTNMYRHFEVNRSMNKAKRIVGDLFALFHTDLQTLPTEWAEMCDQPGSRLTARVVCNYIAGMTDRFALQEHKRLFDLSSGI
jgi:dGTPase